MSLYSKIDDVICMFVPTKSPVELYFLLWKVDPGIRWLNYEGKFLMNGSAPSPCSILTIMSDFSWDLVTENSTSPPYSPCFPLAMWDNLLTLSLPSTMIHRCLRPPRSRSHCASCPPCRTRSQLNLFFKTNHIENGKWGLQHCYKDTQERGSSFGTM